MVEMFQAEFGMTMFPLLSELVLMQGDKYTRTGTFIVHTIRTFSCVDTELQAD